MNCKFGNLISQHISTLMQAFDKELSHYNMRMITTKCLNTSVLVLYLFIGNVNKTFDHTFFCDVPILRERYKNSNDTDKQMTTFLADLLNKNNKTRQLFYVMISDAQLKNEGCDAYFPGHCFIIEKFTLSNNKDIMYKLYQSYVTQYKLVESEIFNHDYIKNMFTRIGTNLTSARWSSDNTATWMDLTNVDGKKFEGCTIKDKLLFCYKKITTDQCLSTLYKLVDNKITEIQKLRDDDDMFTLKNTDTYSEPRKTRQHMLTDLAILKSKISQK